MSQKDTHTPAQMKKKMGGFITTLIVPPIMGVEDAVQRQTQIFEQHAYDYPGPVNGEQITDRPIIDERG